MSGRLWLAASTLGFVASALLHLGTFSPAAARLTDAHAALLFAAAFVPLAAMIVRLRRAAAPARQWRRLRLDDWRLLAALVPGPVRALVFATGMYVLMNLVLSLMLIGGASAVEVDGKYYLTAGATDRHEVSRADYEAHRAAALRLSSGHLLLFYLVPLVYFAFVDPRREQRRSVEFPGPGC